MVCATRGGADERRARTHLVAKDHVGVLARLLVAHRPQRINGLEAGAAADLADRLLQIHELLVRVLAGRARIVAIGIAAQHTQRVAQRLLIILLLQTDGQRHRLGVLGLVLNASGGGGLLGLARILLGLQLPRQLEALAGLLVHALEHAGVHGLISAGLEAL